MQLNREINPTKYQIQQCNPNSIVINNATYKQSMLVMPEYIAPWQLHNIADLTSQDLSLLADLKPEIILLGTGSELSFPSPAITQILFPLRIGLEIMTTAAACRTYAALSSEYRNVLAALVICSDHS